VTQATTFQIKLDNADGAARLRLNSLGKAVPAVPDQPELLCLP